MKCYYKILLNKLFLTQINQVVSIHTKEYDISYLVKNDIIGKMLHQHVTPNHNPHQLDKIV